MNGTCNDVMPHENKHVHIGIPHLTEGNIHIDEEVNVFHCRYPLFIIR